MEYLKIGEFCSMLGVTPDFVKHYEKYGLIQPVSSESGYRYFRSEDCANVIECLKYRSLGFSLSEMANLINLQDVEEYQNILEKRCGEIEKGIQYQNAVLKEFMYLSQRIFSSVDEWSIKKLRGTYYLPHLIDGKLNTHPDTIKVFSEWVNKQPLTKPCNRTKLRADGTLDMKTSSEGLLLYEKHAQILDLPLESPVCWAPLRKCFMLNTKITVSKSFNNTVELAFNKAIEIMREHRLEPCDYVEIQRYHSVEDDRQVTQYCLITIPIK